ncbi:hypothetical protein MAM1_0340d09835 [Mucor ambiguus]|uniref:Pentacotripeptide-repeat region of PRORP domain-containing protein n=1 Tax=Mucor ambiguus TaxID=91626 RepID=A0A0C9N2P8_9FUNG|nr:hypothetical protein MAM1_0340d09835 [Mucor ambiguus]
MLSSIAARSCKQSRICQCKAKSTNTILWLRESSKQLYIKRRLSSNSQSRKSTFDIANVKHTGHTWTPKYVTFRPLSTETKLTDVETKHVDRNYDDILSVALDQSNVSIAQSLVDTTLGLLRKGKPELAWECYLDLTSRNQQRHVSREQYKQLIKYFNHHKSNNEQGLEYVLTLVEDMKQLGYQVGRKEKLLVMRLLGLNGNLSAMERVFEDLSKEQLLEITDPAAAQKPFNIMLTAYNEHTDKVGARVAAEKSMRLYGEMLDRNIQPAEGTTRLLISNIRTAENSDEMVEDVWNWVWTKIGMNVGGKTKELEPSLYRGMVLYFASVGRAEYALEINDIMTKKKISRTVPTMTALIHKVGRAGDIDKAMQLFNEMVIVEGLIPTAVTFNALIDIHAHKKPVPDVAGANRMLNTMREVGLHPNDVTFGTLIDMYAKQGDLSNVKQVYMDMVHKYHFNASPHVYSSLIECYMKLNDKDSAMEVLTLLKKQTHRRTSVAREAQNLMFKGLIENNYIAEGIDLLGAMIKDKFQVNMQTFTPLLSYYANQGDTEGAHKVASMMTQANVKPSPQTYSCLLKAYAKAGDIEGAENIFTIYKQKYRPNAYVYNALLYVYTKKNEMDKVLDTYKRMSAAYVPANVYTYGILMNFYSKRKELKAVEALMETMQSNNITPSVTCWTILMQAYFECEKPDKGRRLIEQMIQAGLEPSNVSWAVLISGCIKANELEFAESVLEEITERSKRLLAPPMLLSDCNRVSEGTYAKVIPETIEDVLSKSQHLLQSRSTVPSHLFTPIIEAYSKRGDFDKAKSVFRNMYDMKVAVTVETYTVIMNLFKRENKLDAVESLWNALYKPRKEQTHVDNVDPLLPKVPLPAKTYSYTNLLTLDQDDTEESTEVVTNHVTPFALSIFIDALMAQERADDIQTLWQQLTSEGYRFDEQNWNRYITSLITSGKLDEACTLAYREFFDSKSKQDVDSKVGTYKSVRKRDDFSISNDNQLHTRTCASFADAFQITGAENMGEPRLRSAVSAKIKEYMHQKDKLDQKL